MSRVIAAVLPRWEPIRIHFDLAEIMGDLDPRWQEWDGSDGTEA